MLHNIPEGMATYVASYHSVTSGLPLAIAIAIHNVPEGLAVRYLVITPSRLGITPSQLLKPVGRTIANPRPHPHPHPHPYPHPPPHLSPSPSPSPLTPNP